MKRWFAALLPVAAALALTIPLAAQDDAPQAGTLIPIGGGYTTLYDFVDAAVPFWETLGSDQFYMLMMPMSFTYDPFNLTQTDLLDNTWFADRRRYQLEESCRAVMADIERPEVTCRVVVPPIYTREAAQDELALDYFADDLAAVYFLGGDQTFAMQITADTPLENALSEAYARGVPMGGNSAGAAMLSFPMVAGYTGDNNEENGLQDGAVVLWNSADSGERGLPFGTDAAIIEQHLWEYVRTPRVLNYLTFADAPNLVIGVDGYTGGILQDETTFGSIFGDYSAAVFDGDTLGASENATFSDEGILSIHDVLVQVLAPGDFSYDIPSRTPSWADLLTTVDRDFSALVAPDGAGRLQVNGGDAPALHEMVADAPVLILLTAFADDDSLNAAAEAVDRQGLVVTLEAGQSIADALPEGSALSDFPFITVIAGDQSLLDAEQLAPVGEAWLAGANVSLVGAAAALAGPTYAANPPVDYDNDDSAVLEAHDQGSFRVGGTNLQPGLGLISVNVEPRLIDNNRFGRLFSLAYSEPDVLALGLPLGAAVTFSSDGAAVSGDNGAFLLDLSQASLDVGTNDAFVIANALLDAFAPGELIEPAS